MNMLGRTSIPINFIAIAVEFSIYKRELNMITSKKILNGTSSTFWNMNKIKKFSAGHDPKNLTVRFYDGHNFTKYNCTSLVYDLNINILSN